jgi:multidrug efflux pump subunit AcrB
VKVTYDPTTFVKDTIHEVRETLIEASSSSSCVYLFLAACVRR